MKEKSIRRNFLLNALLSVCGVIFPLIDFRYVSRILQPEGTGKVSLAISLVSYFTMFASLGIPTYGIRVCAKARDDREQLTRRVYELLGISVVMSLVSWCLLAVTVMVVPRFAQEWQLYAVVSVSILLNVIGMEWLYKGLEQYTYITVRSIACKMIALAAVFLLIHQKEDVIIYGGISIFAASASNILNFVHARKLIDFRRPAGCDWKQHLRPVLIFFAISCAATIYTHLDALMLGLMTTDTDVGYYGAAVKVKTVLVTLVTALGAVVLPRSAYYVEQGRMKEFRTITRKALRFVLLSASPLALFFILFARDIG